MVVCIIAPCIQSAYIVSTGLNAMCIQNRPLSCFEGSRHHSLWSGSFRNRCCEMRGRILQRAGEAPTSRMKTEEAGSSPALDGATRCRSHTQVETNYHRPFARQVDATVRPKSRHPKVVGAAQGFDRAHACVGRALAAIQITKVESFHA